MEPNDRSSASDGRSTLRVGDEIAQSRYRLIALLGRGGMGEVWRAADRLTQLDVALKFLPPELCAVPTEVERFRATLARVRAVRGRYLGPMYDLQEDERAGLFVVMQYIEGETLARRLTRDGRLSPVAAAAILDAIAEGLDDLHAQGLVHCDVKPENVILTRDAYAPLQIIDFGISHELQTSASRVTGKNAWGGGTFLYMAPEQWHGRRPQPRTDQYALGCLAYALLTGDPPFHGAAMVLRECHLSVEPEPIDGLPPAANEALAIALAKDPQRRFASCREFAAAFRRGAALEERVTVPPGPRPASASPDAATAPFAPTEGVFREPASLPAAVVRTRGGASDATVAPATGRALAPPGPRSGNPWASTLRGNAGFLVVGVLGTLVVFGGAAAALFITSSVETRNAPSNAASSGATNATPSAAPTGDSASRADRESSAFVEAPREPEVLPDPTRPRAPGDERRNTLGMRLVWIPPGEFWMGSPADEEGRVGDEARQRVRLTKGFWIAKFETTQAEYRALTGASPSRFSSTGPGSNKVEGVSTDRFPVENVTWNEAVEFCRRLSARENRHYRLPSEAEWEYACRAGTETPFHFGKVNDGTRANCNGLHPYGATTAGPYLDRTSAVGQYPANAWGLHDCHGNVWEWCDDWYAPRVATDPETWVDPHGRPQGDNRVGRGGSWNAKARDVRSAVRGWEHVHYRDEYLGFRVALDE